LADCLQKPTLNPPPTVAANKTDVERYNIWDEFPECKATILDQGCCGSCVAFSVGAEIAVQECMQNSKRGYIKNAGWSRAVAESIIDHRKNFGKFRGPKFTRISEQQLLACSFEQYGKTMKSGTWDDTCDGFWPDKEHEMIGKQGVIPYDDMSYEEGDTYWMSDVCSASGSTVEAECAVGDADRVAGKGCVQVTIKTFDEAKAHLAQYGPLVGSLDPTALKFSAADVMFWYSHKILVSGPSSGHAVLVHGFGFKGDTKIPYLMVHNSWGSSWGDYGEVIVAYSSFQALNGCKPPPL
jgi:hypothetical protein